MADAAETRVVLDPAIAEIVREAVETGEYAADTEVVREALAEWRLRRVLNDADSSAIRALGTKELRAARGNSRAWMKSLRRPAGVGL